MPEPGRLPLGVIACRLLRLRDGFRHQAIHLLADFAVGGRDALGLQIARNLAQHVGIAGFLDRVVPREAWGADESLRFKDGVNLWPTAFVAPSLLVVHHTAGDHEIEIRMRGFETFHQHVYVSAGDTLDIAHGNLCCKRCTNGNSLIPT